MKLFSLISLCIILSSLDLSFNYLSAQNNLLVGLPIIRNYLPSEHGGTPQNWAIVQDKRGIMYFANTGGVIEYDGSNWRIIEIENEVARTIAINDSGTIFVGGVDQFGLLQTDAKGKLQFKSLIKHLPISERNFGDIWTIWPVAEGVYFQSASHIFYLENSAIYSRDKNSNATKIWKSKSIFSPAFIVNDEYFVPEIGTGLCVIENDSVKLTKNGEGFKDLTIYSMLPLESGKISDNKILVGTDNGFYIFNNNSISKFRTDADKYIIENQLYFRGAILSNNTFAFGTQNGGMFVIDQNGKLLSVINKTIGLNDNTVWFIYPCPSGELWLGLNNGIARLNYPSALSVFDSHFGLDGSLFAIHEYANKLFVSSANGIYYAVNSERRDYNSTFTKVEGINSESWEILDLGEYQLVATTNGVYKLYGTNTELINTSWRFAYSFCRSRVDENLIYVGLHDGLATLKKIDGKWIDGGRIPGVSEIIYHIIEEKDGTIWLATFNRGLIKIIPHSNGQNSSFSISRFGKEQGIPDQGLIPIEFNNKIIFGYANGFILFDNNENSFYHENVFGGYFSEGYKVSDVKKDIQGNIWILGGRNKNIELSRVNFSEEGTPGRKTYPILNTILERDFNFIPYRLFPDRKTRDIIWITAGNKLYRFDVKSFNQTITRVNYPALIREVKTEGDSIIYYGGLISKLDSEDKEWSIPSNLTSIEFNYSISSYINEESHQYQYYLEGFDKDWSEWSKEPWKEYTNLPSGNFNFHVRAINAYGEISPEAVFSFYIPTPWYISRWVVFVYILIFLSAIWLFINYRVKYLEKRNVELESLVNERTKEVREQKETLEDQAKKLVELDRLKSNFFTNISHEFRTPLTLVMGQIENILDSTTEEKIKTKLKMALSNSKRLHSLINQLLELSRLEAGEIKLKVANVELVRFLKKVFSAFESYSERKNVKLEFTSSLESVYIYFDKEKLEEIFNNLISNAIKFTPNGGVISLVINETEAKNRIEIFVKDSGIGISESALPHIFDRFYQVDGSHTREYEGTGIGLAIVKELVDLHNGEIKVESSSGKGTTFKIYLQIGKEHLLNKSFVELVHDDENSRIYNKVRDEIDSEENPTLVDDEESGIKDKEIVLIVEDNTEMRNYIQEQLTENFNVLLAKNGEEGIKKAFDFVPDLVITDVMMPITNGYDLALKLKNDRRTSHIPIIMLTAKADEESKLKGLDIGVDDYLIKPFSKKELFARVGNLIKLRSLLKERYKEVSAISIDKIEAKPIDQEFLEKVFNCIKKNIENPQFGVTYLANEVGLSVSQLNRKLNALINQSAGKLIRATRLDYAAELLKSKVGNISEIAFRVGFSDAPGFTHSFKEKFGVPPSEYVKSE